MESGAWKLDDELLYGAWNTKMKSLLMPCVEGASVLSWDDLHMVMGTVVQMDQNVLSISAMIFHPYGGFEEADSKLNHDIQIDDLQDRAICIKPGCQITCVGKGIRDDGQKKLHLAADTLILHRPDFSADFSWDAIHLYCGAFGGWSQALCWLSKTRQGTVCSREIFVDHDSDVMQCWAQKFALKFATLPIGKIKVWDAAPKAGFLGAIEDRSWMHAVFSQVNLLMTASPPCVSWSRGGKKRGLQCQEGWSFVESIFNGFLTQACILTFECADDFPQHPEARMVFELLEFLGFKKIWDQIVTLHQLSDCFRTR